VLNVPCACVRVCVCVRRYLVLASFFFLRILCPAIASPHQSGIIDGMQLYRTLGVHLPCKQRKGG